MAKTRLAIVGASARAAAFSALRAGFDVVTADLFADEDLRRRCPATKINDYPAGLADWLATQEVDAWMYTGALENYPELVDRMAKIRPLWGNQGEPLRKSRDPFRVLQACHDRKLLFPDSAPEPKGLSADGSWLAKTGRGANGFGVWRLYSSADFSRAIEQRAFYQRCVAGTPAAAIFAIDRSASRIIGLTEQLVGHHVFGAKPWSYCGSVVRSDWLTHYAEPLSAIGDMLREDVRLQGIVGIDLLIADDRMWVIEINPRYTASVEVAESMIGVHAASLHARCFGSCPAEASLPDSPRVLGKAVLYAKQSVRLSDGFHEWAMTRAEQGGLADIPASGGAISRRQPVLTLLHRNESSDIVKSLTQVAAEVESRLYG